MKFFDAHTHIQFSGYDVDRDAVIARAREAGVGMVTVGTQRDTSQAAVALAEKHPGVIYAAVGLHPVHTSKSYHDAEELGGGEAAKEFTSRGEVFDFDYYKNLAVRPEVVAIGECGLDYYRFNEVEPKEDQIKKQKDAFLMQIRLAQEINKPLMIHCRNAFPDLIEMLSDLRLAISQSPNPGIIHFFTGTSDEARALLGLGFSFTFGGVVTFARSYDEVVKLIPMRPHPLRNRCALSCSHAVSQQAQRTCVYCGNRKKTRRTQRCAPRCHGRTNSNQRPTHLLHFLSTKKSGSKTSFCRKITH